MYPDVNRRAGSEALVVFYVFFKKKKEGGLQLPDAGFLFFCKCWVFSGRSGEKTKPHHVTGHHLQLSHIRVLLELRGLHLIISVHLTASCSSISLSLY